MIRRLVLLDLAMLLAAAATALAEAIYTSFDARAFVGLPALLALVAAIPLGWRSRLLAPAAGMLVVASYYTLDRYYTHTRFSQESGSVSPWWIWGLLAVTFATAKVPRVGALLAFVWLGTLVALGVGH